MGIGGDLKAQAEEDERKRFVAIQEKVVDLINAGEWPDTEQYLDTHLPAPTEKEYENIREAVWYNTCGAAIYCDVYHGWVITDLR